MTIRLTLALLLATMTPSIAQVPAQSHDRAAEIHRRALTLDTHVDTPIVMQRPSFDIRERHHPIDDLSQVDFPRMIEGGLDAAFFAVYLPQGPRTGPARTRAKERARDIFALIHNMIDENPDVVELALTADDAERVRQAGKRAIYIGIENGYVIGRDLDVIEEFYNLGARYITLSHTSHNDLCDSSTDPRGPEHGGLSELGRLVIQEMNRLGMMVDISHISDDAAWQAIELSKAPVIASHSSAYAVYPHPRNLNDDLLRKIAETGGVVQMNMLGGYLADLPVQPERQQALREWRNQFGRRISALPPERQDEAVRARAAIDRQFPPALVSLDVVMDHIDHVVKVAGIDHIGIGADFDGGGGVEGCNDVSEIPNITRALLARGYSEEDIGKIWSGNALRVMRANEAVARELQAKPAEQADDHDH
jgi:membrane dipeptidase